MHTIVTPDCPTSRWSAPGKEVDLARGFRHSTAPVLGQRPREANLSTLRKEGGYCGHEEGEEEIAMM